MEIVGVLGFSISCIVLSEEKSEREREKKEEKQQPSERESHA